MTNNKKSERTLDTRIHLRPTGATARQQQGTQSRQCRRSVPHRALLVIIRPVCSIFCAVL